MAVHQIHVWPRIDIMSGKAGEKITITGEEEVAQATNGAPPSKYIRVDADVGGGKVEHTISDGFNWLGKVDKKKADKFLDEELPKVKAAVKEAEESAIRIAHERAEAIRQAAAIAAANLEAEHPAHEAKGKKKDK